MDDLQAYRVAPYDSGTGAPPYDPTTAIHTQAQAFLDANAPRFPAPTDPAQSGTGATAAAPGGKTLWQQQVEALFNSKGKATTPADFDRLKEGFKTQLTPMLFAKKLSKDGVAAELAKFDAKAEQDRATLFPGADGTGATAAAAGGKDSGPGLIRENLASFAGGIAQTVPGLMALADYGIRGAGAVGNYIGELEGNNPHYNTGRSGLGDAAAGISEGINRVVQANTSAETLAQQQEIANAVKQDPSLANVIAQYLGHGRNFGTMVSAGLGSLAVPFGSAKYLGRAGGLLEHASDLRKLGVVATAAGLPQSGVQGIELEQRIDSTPLQELLKDNPAAQSLYDSSNMIGLPKEQTEKRVRDLIKNEALRSALPAYIAGNVGLEFIPGLGGAEARIASRIGATAAEAQHGLLRRVLQGAGSEGLQEGVAAGLQSGGENYGLNRPTTEGMAANVVPSTIAGAVVGGLVGAPGRVKSGVAPTNGGLKRTRAPIDSAAQGATQGAESAPATPAADSTQTPPTAPTAPIFNAVDIPGMAAPAFTEFAGAFDTHIDNLSSKIKKYSSSITTPQEAIDRAEHVARDTAGDKWDALNNTQRADLVERVVSTIGEKKSIPGLGDAIVAYKNNAVNPTAPTTGAVQETGQPNIPSTDTGATELGNEGSAVADNTTPPQTIAPAPAVTPEPQMTADKVKAIAKLRGILTSEFGMTPDEAGAVPLSKIPDLIKDKRTEAAAKRKADAAAKDAEVRDIVETAKGNSAPKITKQAQENIFLDNYLKSLMDKPNPNDSLNRADPRFNAARQQLSQGKITSPESLKAFLESEAAKQTPTTQVTSKPQDNVLVSKLTKSVKKGDAAAKAEAKDHLAYLKTVMEPAGYNQLAEKGTLEQVRSARRQLETQGIKPARKKALPKSKPAVQTTEAKGATPAPKTIAPVAETGAQTKTPAANVKARKAAKTKPTVVEQIRARFKNLDSGVVDDLVTAVELGQQGETTAFNEIVNEAVQNEQITKDDAKELRKLAAQENKPARQALKEEIDALAAEEPADETEDLLSPARVARDMQAHMQVEEATGTQPSDTLYSGRTNPNPTIEDIYNHLRPPSPPAAGVEEITRTLENMRKTTALRPAVDFALWLIKGNPNVVNTLQLTAKAMRAAGTYNPLTLLVTVNSLEAHYSTIVHEFMHHAERMMPTSLQDKLRGEYSGRLVNKLKQAQRNGNQVAEAYLRAVMENLQNPSEQNRKTALDFIISNKLDANEYYKYFSPSEYWAESASEILSRKYSAGSWIGRAKEWMKEFVSRLGTAIGMNTDGNVYKALEHIANTDGRFQSDKMLQDSNATVQDARTATEDENDPFMQSEEDARKAQAEAAQSVKAVRADTQAGAFQHAWEYLSNSVHAFEETEVGLTKIGGELNIDNSPTNNYRIYNGRVSHNNKVDTFQVAQPVVDLVDKMWPTFAHDKQSFLDALNVFFGNTNFLERIRTDWIHKVPLKNGMEVKRIDIFDDLKEGKITPTQARLKLASLAQAHATMDMKEHALKSGITEKTFDAIHRKLDDLFEAGIDKDSMAPINEALDPVRARIRQRLVEAGYFTAADPYQELYGWTHYVPLKGTASESNDLVSQNAFDMIPDDKLALARLNRQIEAMEGRKTFGQRPFERLFVDLARAGERSANKEFMESLYNLVTDNKSLGAKIMAFKGSPREGYTNRNIIDPATGEPKVFAQVPKPKNGAGFIYNDGDVHYSVQLPRSSQLLRGLILMNNVARPAAFVKKWIATPTNFLARGYTTLSPMWQLSKGFVRDLTTLPGTIAVEHFDNPLQASKFITRYGAEILQFYKAAPTFMATMKGDVNALEQMAQDDPNGYAAWVHRWEAGGGSNEFTKGFDLEGVNDLFKGTDVDGVVQIPKAAYAMALKYTGNWANFFEQMSRVAAFKALVESEGLSDKEAAVKVRKVLDYQQTGLWGRNINSFIAFFRVGMTGVDTLRRAFRKPTGGVNVQKMGAWGLPIMGIGALAYMMVSAAMGDDDEGKKRMHKIRASTLTQKLLIPYGDKVGGVELGLGMPQLLLAPGVLLAAVADGHLTMGEAIAELGNTIVRNGPTRLGGNRGTTPTDVLDALRQGFTPTLLAPTETLARNTDVFGRPIHTDHPDTKLAHADQGRASTPQVFSDIARWLHDTTGVDYFPEDIKYLATNYGGQNVSDLIKATADVNAKNTLGMDAEYNPLTDRFEIKDEDYYDQERMYKILDHAGESEQRYNGVIRRAKDAGMSETAAEAAGAQFLRDNPQEKAVIDATKKLRALNTERNKTIRQLGRDRTLSLGRRQAIRKQEDSKMRQATDAVEAALEQVP